MIELLRRQALPLPVDICHFRKPAGRPRLSFSNPLLTPQLPACNSLGPLAPGFEGSRPVKASGLQGARNSRRCVGLASDVPRRRTGKAKKRQSRERIPPFRPSLGYVEIINLSSKHHRWRRVSYFFFPYLSATYARHT